MSGRTGSAAAVAGGVAVLGVLWTAPGLVAGQAPVVSTRNRPSADVPRTADGKPEWVLASQIDVTGRKKAEERLRWSERLLSKTGEVAGVGGWELDLETMELTW